MTLKTACPKPVSPPPAKPRRVKRKNVKRHKREWIRAYHSAERCEFVRSLPCIACGWTPSENAHTVGGGMGRKSDYSCVAPLCKAHHQKLHTLGSKTFESNYLFGALEQYAKETEAAWQAFSASKSHISEREGRAK